MKKILFGWLLLFAAGTATAQNIRTDTIAPADSVQFLAVHFLYGSKPAKGFHASESRRFGGIHGGHVYLQTGDTIFSFRPNHFPVHIFAHQHKRQSSYVIQNLSEFAADTSGNKVLTILLPVNDSAEHVLCRLRKKYQRATPYDYAFFGMRCAASAYEVLARAGLVKMHSHFWDICLNFYPKPLRKRLIRRAERNGYKMIRKPGRSSRKWEKD